MHGATSCKHVALLQSGDASENLPFRGNYGGNKLRKATLETNPGKKFLNLAPFHGSILGEDQLSMNYHIISTWHTDACIFSTDLVVEELLRRRG